MATNSIFAINSLRGGLNDSDAPTALENDACTVAENIEFVRSMLGERRAGCVPITLPTSITGDTTLDAVTWGFRHLPTSNESAAELWLLAQSILSTQNILVRRTQSAWGTISPLDAITSSTNRGHKLSAASLHGKLFLAYKSAVSRLHVYDGTTLRRTGLATPAAAPTGADTGTPGTVYAGTRFFRIRYTVKSGSTTLRRSEPSAVLTFAPSGTGTAARVTKPASISESETHWELEASTDNSNFYRIATTVVGTTTVDDSVAFATGYAISGTLSEDTGDYTNLPSAKFLSVDNDRLILGGDWEDTAAGSRIIWTPTFNAPGSGNDERQEFDTDPTLDLDGFEGGELTGLSRAVNGYLYATKWSHIYKLVRSGIRQRAYDAIPLTKAKGALPGSLVEAIDQTGAPSQYILDPKTGPMRIGASGLQSCSRDIETLWRRVNIDAAIPCHGFYYPESRQVHWHIAVDDSSYPNMKIVAHINEFRDTPDGARRGWVTVSKDSRIATAHCSFMFSANIDSTDARELNLVPFIGKAEWTIDATDIRDLVQRCDTGSTDAHTTGDTASGYRGKVRSKPFLPSGLLGKHGVMSAALIAKSAEDPDDTIYIKGIRDFGTESKTVDTDLNPSGSEEHVIKQLDDLSFSEVYALQIEIGDLDEDVDPASAYEVNGIALRLRKEEGS